MSIEAIRSISPGVTQFVWLDGSDQFAMRVDEANDGTNLFSVSLPVHPAVLVIHRSRAKNAITMTEIWVASGIELARRDLPLLLSPPGRRWYMVKQRGYRIVGDEISHKAVFKPEDLRRIGLAGYTLANEMLADIREADLSAPHKRRPK